MNWLKKFKKMNKNSPPVSSDKFYIIAGSHGKPVVTQQLIDFFDNRENSEGFLYTGYPLIGAIDGAYAIDAMLISKHHGLVVFDIVESSDVGKYQERHDDIYLKLQSYLMLYKEITTGRRLAVDIKIVTIAPQSSLQKIDGDYPIINNINEITNIINMLEWKESDKYYNHLHSVIQNITSIRSSKYKRTLNNKDSRGSQLKKLEDSIANLDHAQAEAVINTYNGVQRIRGLAGSGKTIILALKVAYLHAMNPEWHIAVTFNTRSLKNQFEALITRFVIERTKQEPDWSKISIIHAWGASGDKQREGLYYNFCKDHGEEYLDFSKAKAMWGYDDAFAGACARALKNQKNYIIPKYDAILVDEAQDFSSGASSPFLMLCYELLKEPKRLIYAYDELQSLSMKQMPSPEEIFGNKDNGEPKVKPTQFSDIVLYKCYRNSRPILATAHALGFGIYSKTGPIQMFEDTSIWPDIGYKTISGELKKNHEVTLSRTDETSPKFLENLGPKNDLISFISFPEENKQIEYLVNDIIENISNEELLPRDIIVINPDPLTTRKAVNKARQLLFEKGYNSNLAGVSTSPDIFQEKDAITFTGIHRAKGNEAALVYIINAQYCYNGFSLAQKRNILFTAMTRSKAWVRVIGYGPNMDGLCREYNTIKDKNYNLEFKYPTDEEMKKMNLLHRNKSPEDEKMLNNANQNISDFINLIEQGDLDIEELDQDTIKKLREVISDQ